MNFANFSILQIFSYRTPLVAASYISVDVPNFVQ